MRERASIACAACVAIATCALHVLAEDDVGTFDPDMEIPGVVTNGVKWIDGRLLPLEGRAFDGTEHYYDRLPTNVTANVNSGVREFTLGIEQNASVSPRHTASP